MINQQRSQFIFILFGLLLFATIPLQAEPAAPADRSIYIFGDSWSQQMSTTGTPIPFDQAIITREFDSFVTLHKYGLSGSTLAQWASDEGGILTTLTTAIAADASQNPIIFFTLGGNDLFGGSTTTEMETNLTTILTALEATRNDIQIVYGAYDVPNPNINPLLCLPAMTAIFGSTDPTVVNSTYLVVYQSSVAVIDTFDRAVTVNTFGSLQGTPGNPTISEWSPVQYWSDCIHPNASGYTIYLDTVFSDQLNSLLCADPRVDAAVCPTSEFVYLPIVLQP